jgi:hypothetical protein
MTAERLTAILAERLMGWRACPDRFVKRDRGWVRRGRFRPTENLQDSYELLEAIPSGEYSMGGAKGKSSWAKVRTATVSAEASAPSMPLAVCLAIAKALEIDVGVYE